MQQLKSQLRERLEKIFSKKEIQKLENIFLLEKRNTTFRINMLKSTIQKVEGEMKNNNIGDTKLDFPENCYLLDRKFTEKDLWNLDIYKNGEIYIQGISSQIPPLLFKSPDSLKSGLQLKILDACAAPGGKTSQLAALYPDAEIWAFEPHKIRYDKLNYNLKKLGCKNVKAIQDSIENISQYIQPSLQLSPKGREGKLEYFDMILIDAPCSGEGGIKYNNTKFLESWDIKHIKRNYTRQKSICDAVLPYLKIGGEMIYSTCTIAPEENEGVVHYLLCKYPELDLEKLDITENKYINPSSALKNFEKYFFKREISERCIRVIPSEFSEGFFISKFRKCDL